MRRRVRYIPRPARIRVRVEGPDPSPSTELWMTEPAGKRLQVGDVIELEVN